MKYARFYIEKRKLEKEDKHKEWPVVVWFSYNGKSFHRTIGVKATEQNWDSKKQRLKQNAPRAAELNRYIDLLEEKLDKIYSQALADGRPLDNKFIIAQLKTPDRETQLRKPVSLFDEWEKYLEVQTVRLRHSTLKSAKTAYNHFKQFCKETNKSGIKFDEFTDKIKAEFADYLYKKGNVDNTVHAVQKRMDRFLNYAEKIGLHHNHAHKAFVIPERTGTIKFLEWDEVKRIIDLEVDAGIESDARDLFVFCCSTGLRFGDALKLRKDNIVEHKFKELDAVQYAIHIRQQKTMKPVVIPLLPPALEILRRYKNEKSEFALPQRANQTVNRLIKQIGRRAKLNDMVELITYRKGQVERSNIEKWKTLSTHMGRRTFSTLLMNHGVPINLACSITGNTPKVMLAHYAGVIDSKKFIAMDNMMRF